MTSLADLFSLTVPLKELQSDLSRAIAVNADTGKQPFCELIQGRVNPGHAPFRAVSLGDEAMSTNTIRCAVLSGKPDAGMTIRQLPDSFEATALEIYTELEAGPDNLQIIRMELDKNLPDISGRLWMVSDDPATVGHLFDVTLLWTSKDPLLPGRVYSMHTVTGTVDATVTAIKYEIRQGSTERLAAKIMHKNELGICTISLTEDLAFDPAFDNPFTGSFLLTNKDESTVLAVGGINFTLRRSSNITRQHLEVNKAARAVHKEQKPCVVWLTGLSGSGKSTIANKLEQKLHALGKHTYILDGDNVRHGLNKDLGFTDEDRVENIRRISEVAKLMVDAGLIVITAFISPFRAEREMARGVFEKGEFIEVYVNTPLEVAEQRDVKGLYKKARSGQLKNFTGIDSPYQAPEHAEFEVRTDTMSADEAAELILTRII